MKLKDINDTYSPKPKTKVWQPEERQKTGEQDANHWYQKYYRKAPVYHWSHGYGPKPEGYKESILTDYQPPDK